MSDPLAAPVVDSGADGRKKRWSKRARRTLLRRVPILRWLPGYTRGDAVCDVVAGVTVGLTLMPQAIAYAGLAGLAAQHGLYSAFAGHLLYVLFGTIKQVSIGPTSLMAILASSYTRGLPVEFMILLALLAGCVELCMGLLNLGFLVDFISAPVVSGFTSATSVIIVATQLRGLLGLRSTGGHRFFARVWSALKQLASGELNLGDAVIGLGSVIFLLCLRRLSRDMACVRSPRIRRALWFVSISRNALIVVACSTLAWWYENAGGGVPFQLSGEVPQGLPALRFPNTTVHHGNQTYSFMEMCETLGTGLLFVPLVAVLANVAIAKSFAAGRMVDAGQEMIALGVCNVVGSLVQAMPTCGAFTRSAVSDASGVRTPLAGAYTGAIILLALTYLTPYFRYIPSACLSAVLVTAVVFMVDWQIIPRLWRSGSRYDLMLVALTFGTSLWRGVEFGLVVGTCADLLRLAAPWSRPSVKVGEAFGCSVVCPELGLLYPGVDHVRQAVAKAASSGSASTPILLDCSGVLRCDYTALRGLHGLLGEHPRVRIAAASADMRARLLAAAAGSDRDELAARMYDTLQEAADDVRLQEKTPLLEAGQIIVQMDNNNGRKQSLYDNVDDGKT